MIVWTNLPNRIRNSLSCIMKTNQIKLQNLLESIVEAHQQGEWWIDDAGEIDPSKQKAIKSPDEAMKDGWKHMTASKGKIEVVTWELKAEDLRIIIGGIKKIMGVEKTEEDPDAVVGKDGYTGPRIDLLLKRKGKSFNNVPLGILEKCLPSRVKNYEDGKEPELAGPVNEDKSFHHHHKDYRLFEGDDHIIAIFEDNSRLVFEVHYHDKHGEDREKWRRQAFSKWKSIANEIHRDVQLTEAGNPMEKSWKECFQEALKHPKLKDYIRKPHHQKVFDDKGYSASAKV